MPPYIACRLLCIAIIAFALAPAMANELSPENTFPSFAELHAAGVIIGEIRINVQDIFDLDDPKEHNFLFRLANTLHINTRPDVIRRTLLFKSGETVSVRLIEETERLLHDNRYLYDVSIRPVAYQSGVVDIEVKTIYALDPTLLAPAQLPPDQKLVSPFVRYEVVEDGYQKFKNRDQIQRPEYVAMGFQSRVQLSRSFIGLGSTQDLWFYNGNVSNGYEISSDKTLLVSGSLSGKHGGGLDEDQLFSAAARYHHRQSERSTFFASVSGDVAHNPQSTEVLLLGGDNGLRGYPLRYQSGDKRALLTVEQRVYSDWYPFRLFRVGGAVFYDQYLIKSKVSF